MRRPRGWPPRRSGLRPPSSSLRGWLHQQQLGNDYQMSLKFIFIHWIIIVSHGNCLLTSAHLQHQIRGRIQRESGGFGPYSGADHNLTLSHRWIRSPAFQPPTMTNADELLKNGTTAIVKRKVLGRGKEGLWSGFIFKNIHFMEPGKPSSWVDFNITLYLGLQ